MRKATKTAASWLGVVAGIAGFEHGYFEFLQGNTPTPGLAFPSWGPPCVPEEIWHNCEPAMSILPNLLITGILAMLLSVALIVWAGWFVQRKHGGWVQLALSVLLLLFGGGFFPPIIAFVGGVAGTQINRFFSHGGTYEHVAQEAGFKVVAVGPSMSPGRAAEYMAFNRGEGWFAT